MFEKVTFADGIHSISNEEYHAANGISRSQLKLFDKSPYHFWFKVYSGEAEQKKPTKALNIGAVFHTKLLEPELFAAEYIVKPKLDKLPEKVLLKESGRELFEQYKIDLEIQSAINAQLKEQFEIDSIGKTIITIDEHNTVIRMIELAKRHDIVDTLLADAIMEQSIFWTDPETGLQFKVRPDIWSPKIVVDLKTIKDAELYKLKRAALDRGYFLQAGMLYEACKAIEKPFEMFAILLVEKEEPYAPSAFILKDEALQYGIDQFQIYKHKLADCIENNDWPSYEIKELDVPGYAKKLED